MIMQLESIGNVHKVIEHMAQGLLFIDWQGMICTVNPKAQFLLEISQENVIDQPFLNHFRDNHFGFSIQKSLELKKVPAPLFIHIVSRTNQEYDFEITPVIDEKGIFILITDKTELRQLQVNHYRNERMKELGSMAATLAHEIRNPLGGIKGYASLLQRDLKEFPQMQQMVNYIIEGTDHLNKLVSNVLNYAHPFKIQFESTDLVALIFELQQHVKADENYVDQILFQLNTSMPSLTLPIDVNLMRSALLNLIVNGMQAMPEGGILSVNLHEEDNFAIIRIVDTGIGISPENLKKIFTAFFTTKTSGNGFGLLEVYKAVQAHGGTAEVASTLGEGTTFTLKLPLSR